MRRRLQRVLVTMALMITAIAGTPVASPAADAVTPELTVESRTEPVQAPRDTTAAYLIDYVSLSVKTGLDHHGIIEIFVYSDHRKHLRVCDQYGERKEPTLQVDPSTAAPLLYQDPNGSHAGCLEHDIWYPVRKFRIGVHREGNGEVALAWGDWFSKPPLPRPDF